MLPNPLHPAVVHFPVVLMFLVPLFAAGAIWAIKRGVAFRRAWAVPVAFCAALTTSALVAVQTGEDQTERVERVVPDQPLEQHEERAELFLTWAGVLTLVSGLGFARGVLGRSARVATTAGAVALIGLGAAVGHSGGELVYRYGAASASTQSSGDTSAQHDERESRERGR